MKNIIRRTVSMKLRKRKRDVSSSSGTLQLELGRKPTRRQKDARTVSTSTSSKEPTLEVVKTIQNLLEKSSTVKYKNWSENYVKGAKFRGVKMAGIRKAVKEAIKVKEFNNIFASSEKSLDLAMSLLEQEMSEDRLAGTLLVAEHIIPSGQLDKADRWEKAMLQFSGLYKDHLIDWNTNDWFSQKVLSKLFARAEPKQVSS